MKFKEEKHCFINNETTVQKCITNFRFLVNNLKMKQFEIV